MLDNYQYLIDELLSAPKLVRDTIAAHGGEAPDDVRGLIAMLAERDGVMLDRLTRVKREQFANLRALPDLSDAQPPAADYAQRAIEEQIVGVALGQRGAGGLDHPRQVPVTQHDPGQIGQRIPAQGEKTEVDPRCKPQCRPFDRCTACGSRDRV